MMTQNNQLFYGIITMYTLRVYKCKANALNPLLDIHGGLQFGVAQLNIMRR